ncbi:signal transduction histidine kinase regulating citrate/malate metabolism [Eubacterium sp. CAG:192]|nr:signal transduction histidine kinase regulating citrate/malate metabolism [Eubacterium sp. CAG:192]
MNIFCNILANLFHIMGILLIAENILQFTKSKNSNGLKILATIIVSIFSANPVLMKHTGLDLISFLVCIFIIMKICFGEKNKTVIVYIIGSSMVLECVEMFFSQIVETIVEMLKLNARNYSNLIASLLTLICIIVLSIIIKRKYIYGIKKIAVKYWIIMTINIMANFCVLAILTYITMKQVVHDGKAVYIIIYLLVSIGLIIQIVSTVALIISRNIHRENEMLAKKYLEEQKNYYEYLEQREVETKKFRHDIRNHLYLLDKVKKEGKNEEFEKYLQDIIERVDRLGTKVNVGNDIANAILDKYYAEAINKGINIQIQGHFPINCSVSAYHLCTIFSNLLSNAIEAAEKATIKKVWVICRYTENEIIIEIGNSYCDNNLNKKNLKTKKPEKQYHGWGLKNVEDSVNACNGLIDIEIENGCFVVSVTLKNNEV